MEVRRAADRFTTRTDWLESRHSFSFGPHYDPANTAHGLLVVHNDDVVQPGTGFEAHPHVDMEIVTWVLAGSLRHEDSTGHCGVIHPGLAQRMSAGTGIVHSETNDSRGLSGPEHDRPVHFVQMWVLPDEPGLVPGYAQRDVSGDLDRGGWVTVASGMPAHRDTAAVGIQNSRAALHVARLGPGARVELPGAPYLHVFVARGEVDLEGAGTLTAGDAVRISGEGGHRLTGRSREAEALVWEMHGAR